MCRSLLALPSWSPSWPASLSAPGRNGSGQRERVWCKTHECFCSGYKQGSGGLVAGSALLIGLALGYFDSDASDDSNSEADNHEDSDDADDSSEGAERDADSDE